jgi:hypothetical protein
MVYSLNIMRVLFLAHPGFLIPRSPALQWLGEFEKRLKLAGHTVTRFRPLETRVGEFDVIHLFSFDDPGLWEQLSHQARKVVITPSLSLEPPAERAQARQWIGQGIRILRAARQKRWPPIDTAYLHRSVSHFLVTSPQWQDHLRSQVDAKKISIITEDPEAAAKVADRVYRQAATS